MSKIGENVIAKQEEKQPYTAYGMAEDSDGKYMIIELKVSGMEVLSRKVVRKADNYAEAISEFRIVTANFTINFTHNKLNGNK